MLEDSEENTLAGKLYAYVGCVCVRECVHVHTYMHTVGNMTGEVTSMDMINSKQTMLRHTIIAENQR